jgi:hypothetical protein
MKLLNKLVLSLVIFLVSSSVFSECKSSSKRSSTSTQYWIRPLIKNAKGYLSFANLAYCKPEIINALACPLCSSILDGSFKVLDVHSAVFKNHTYRYVILASESHKEVVISFAGPKFNDGLFFTSIYTSGWHALHGEQIEKAYTNVYNSHIAASLHKSVGALAGKLKGYKYILIGHSFGGSLAVLAAFDLMKKNLLQKTPESPLVYSYGQLRIGDDHFVETVNSMFKVVRIVKNSDFMGRIPNCVFSKQTGNWRCFRDTQNLMMRFPEYRRYIMNYGQHNGQKQHYTGLQAAYGNNGRSFLEKSVRNKKGYFYTAHNPGNKVYSYGSTTTNAGANGFGNIQYSQPMGAEVLFSKRFTKFQVCSYFKGIPNCEQQLPKKFHPSGHANYYGENVEEC